MKKVLFTLSTIMLIISCQKEVSDKQQSSIQTENDIIGTNPADSVVFYDWADPNYVVNGISGKYTRVLTDNFSVTDSTAFYFKKAVFKFRFSKGVNATKARLYIDASRHVRPIEGIVSGDSIVFENRNAEQLTPQHVNRYEHWLNMQILATASPGDSMRARLVYVIVINKQVPIHYQVPQSQVAGLPEVGNAIHFVQ